jgi:hypothetical protein
MCHPIRIAFLLFLVSLLSGCQGEPDNPAEEPQPRVKGGKQAVQDQPWDNEPTAPGSGRKELDPIPEPVIVGPEVPPANDLGRLVGDISRLDFRYWRWTGRDEITEWDVHIQGPKVGRMFSLADTYRYDTWWLWCWEGTITTPMGKYHVLIGVHKVSTLPFVIRVSKDRFGDPGYVFKIPKRKVPAFRNWLNKHIRETVRTVKGVKK